MDTYKNAPAGHEPTKGAHHYTQAVNDISTAAQRKRLLAAFLDIGAINTIYARDRLNIMAPAARIKELRDMGHKIHTDRITITDQQGHAHINVARYVLIEMAQGVEA